MLISNILQELDQCIKCGLCLATCPVCKELLLEKYTPRGKMQLAKNYTLGKLQLSDRYRDIFSKCLLCGACNVTCPSGVDLYNVMVGMRQKITTERGLHPHVESVVHSLIDNYNITADDNEERDEWLEDIEEVYDYIANKKKAEVVYFVGCVSSFFPMVQQIPINLVQIFMKAGVDFTILGGEEWCCGFPLIGAGDIENATVMIEHNIKAIKSLGAQKVVFTCPTCLRTWKDYYQTDLELFHSTEFLVKLVEDRIIQFGEVKTTVTYHDPCDLGRNGGVYEAPRRILDRVPGLTLVEMDKNRASSLCCGGGGNLEMTDADLSGLLAGKKIEAIKSTGADTVVTACQQCVRTIKSKAKKDEIDLEVIDITDVVIKAMSNK